LSGGESVNSLNKIISRRRLVIFFFLAYLFTYPLAALYSVSLIFPLLALFAPAVAACIMLGATKGKTGIKKLFERLLLWRVPLQWYVFVVCLPLLLVVAVWAIHAIFWEATPFRLLELSPVSFLIAFLIIGEELGWRGFALPELQKRFSAITASLILGILWAFWHLPNFLIPGYPHYGQSFFAFLLAATAYSMLITFVFNRTSGSVLVASIFHASINLLSPAGIPAERALWLEALVYGFTGIILWIIFGANTERDKRR
jgi:uncharacterized protein